MQPDFCHGLLAAAESQVVTGLLSLVGWSRLSWKAPIVVLPEGKRIDFGGIGREYAADRAAAVARKI
ncbi:hypothetical protein [Candidatus Rariloculus sp.]|uniref:hypothetical protein n=1 Tax=Candidatus Rariloculus sp. TaxID=3101265 RepID=UPI003D0F15B9